MNCENVVRPHELRSLGSERHQRAAPLRLCFQARALDVGDRLRLDRTAAPAARCTN
jgi:hypothetical protein